MKATYLLATDVPNVVVTAIGVAIAAVALVVARLSRNDSREANSLAQDANDKADRQASAAERALALSVRPVIVGDPKAEAPFAYRTEPNDEDNSAHRGDFAFYMSFPVRNVGIGPALIHSAHVETVSHGRLEASNDILVGVNRVVIPQGETALFYCRLVQLSLETGMIRRDIEENGFSVLIRFMDLAEQQRILTVMGLNTRPSTKDLEMVSLELFACNEKWEPARNSFASNLGLSDER